MSLGSEAIALVSKILTQMSIKGQTGIKSIPNAREIQNKAMDIVAEMRSKGYDLSRDFSPANIKLFLNNKFFTPKEFRNKEGIDSLMKKKITPHKQKNQLGFMSKNYPEGVEPGSTAAKAIDESTLYKAKKFEGLDYDTQSIPADMYKEVFKGETAGITKIQNQMSKVQKASDDLGKTLGKNESVLKDVFENMFGGFTPKVVPKLSTDQIKKIKETVSSRVNKQSAEENKKYARELMTDNDEFRNLPDNDRKELLDLIEDKIEIDEFSKGGLARFSFKNGKGLTRRTFLKLMGGLAALPVVGKFLGPATKVAEKAGPVAAEGFKIGKENFLLLVDKIKRFGKKTDGLATKEREVGYVYSDKKGNTYELVEDVSSGDTRIIKDRGGVGSYGDKTFDTIDDRTVMELKKGEYIKNKKGKIIKTKDEYTENQEVAGVDGTFDDFDDVADDVVEEVMEEVGGTVIKKKSGGLATMFKKKNV